jgi:dynein heavy chain, axonemal
MITLFRMINNMMIESATKFLDPGSLFQGEPDEALVGLGKVIRILEDHKACFKEYREKLPSYAARLSPDKDPILWTFRPKDIFERFDQFMARLYDVRDIFDTANEFFKVEKIELGGLKGRNLSRVIQEIYNEFKTIYIGWSQIQFDPLDPSPKLNHFNKERTKFQDESEVLERRLSAILVQAFDECFTIESLIKLIEVCGSMLQRPIVYKEIKDKLNAIVELYDQDLDMVKGVFDEGIDSINSGGVDALRVDRSFPPVTGALTWIKKMKLRITKPTEDLPNIEFRDIFETEAGIYTMDKLQEMCGMLDKLEVEIFDQWKAKVPGEINENMRKFLLKTADRGLLELNFDPMLVAALKEVKMLRAMKKEKIPDVAVELFENSNQLWVS